MKRYGILTIYNCGRVKTHYVEAENVDMLWNQFYKHHNKKKIQEATIYSWENINVKKG